MAIKRVTVSVHHGRADTAKFLYAVVRDAATGEVEIGATLEYCLNVIKERGWLAVKPK
jgi:hypothetical protein